MTDKDIWAIIQISIDPRFEIRDFLNELWNDEAGLDELPPTLGFNSPNASSGKCGVTKFTHGCCSRLGWDSFNFNSLVPYSPRTDMSPFHVIFYLNQVLIATHFNKGFHIVILCTELNEFLEKCLAQFQVYIWFAAQCHNTYNYLDQIWHILFFLYMLPKCLIRSFACEIPISC